MNKKIVLVIISCLLAVFSAQSQSNKSKRAGLNLLDNKGEKTGLWIEDDGYKETYYRNGLADGICKLYSRYNKKLSFFGVYSKGKPIGPCYYFNNESQLYMREQNISINTQRIKDESGKYILLDYKSNIVMYHLNGNIESEGSALYDDLEIEYFEFGEWKYYDESGKLIKTENFK